MLPYSPTTVNFLHIEYVVVEPKSIKEKFSSSRVLVVEQLFHHIYLLVPCAVEQHVSLSDHVSFATCAVDHHD